MKIKPETILINKTNIKSNRILVTGSDEAYISFVTNYIIKYFKDKNYYIDTSSKINKNIVGDLFSEKKVLFILKDYDSKNIDLDNADLDKQIILISSSNNKKINSIKYEFLKSKQKLLIECYPLNRSSKESIVKGFVDSNDLYLSNSVFWYVVENFNNNYLLLIKQLEILSLYNKKIDLVEDVENSVFVENKIEINKLFFYIFKNNKDLISSFNTNIFTQGDFYIFLNSIKNYINIISTATTQDDALKKFPKYLFNEKEIFIKIYNKINKSKIFKIYKNISKIEQLTRKNPDLYKIIGIRFLINIKQTITS
jgi:hypothetical protein